MKTRPFNYWSCRNGPRYTSDTRWRRST